MRKYYPIWQELKKKKRVVVIHPPHLHARIIKAVLKERTMDTGFRFELSEANSCAKVLTSVNPDTPNMITFRLKFYLDPTDV